MASNRLDRSESHLCGTPAREEAKHHFFPKLQVAAVLPNFLKLKESFANIILLITISCEDSLLCYRFRIAFHKFTLEPLQSYFPPMAAVNDHVQS